MKNKTSKFAILLAILFELIIVISFFISITANQRKSLWISLLAVICIFLPFIISYIANKKAVVLPPSFQVITLIFIFLAQYLGEIRKFYMKLWWWDLLLHFIFGSYAVITALYLTHGIIIRDQNISEKRFTIFRIIFAFSFSITLGTLWEVFEFLGDYLFKTSMVKGGLEDTLTDIIAKVLSAFITSIAYYYHKNKSF